MRASRDDLNYTEFEITDNFSQGRADSQSNIEIFINNAPTVGLAFATVLIRDDDVIDTAF